MSLPPEKSYHHLDLDMRRQIYRMREAGKSLAEIAQATGRHRSTIYRELQRNTFWDEDLVNTGYFPVNAQEFYQRRRQKQKKLLSDEALQAFVIAQLREGWSPKQIAGYLRRRAHSGTDELACVSHETIYQFIYGSEGGKLGLYRYLPRTLVNRRKRGTRKPRHLRGIPEHRHISNRPMEIEHRRTCGHWEGDLVMFCREHGPANLTSLVERRSRFLLIRRNSNRTSWHVL